MNITHEHLSAEPFRTRGPRGGVQPMLDQRPTTYDLTRPTAYDPMQKRTKPQIPQLHGMLLGAVLLAPCAISMILLACYSYGRMVLWEVS